MKPEKQLFILPGAQQTLGGALVSLSVLIKGFEQCDKAKNLKILTWSDSLLEQYIKAAGQEAYLQIFPGKDKQEFMQIAFKWIHQQPQNSPLLLENCVERQIMPILISSAPKLRFSRPVYCVFRDLALSYNPLGYLARKIAFASLKAGAICNSRYTASHIKRLTPNIKGILYPPVDLTKFNSNTSNTQPPKELLPILQTGKKLMLTPSRIKLSGDMNDKNLFALLPALADLKARGHNYHGIIVGEDKTPDKIASHRLYEEAQKLGVADSFSILPPTFHIENYYKYADVVVTLAPREPFGRTVVEAIACGVPVIGSNTGGIAEILGHFAPQWAVDPKDSQAVAEAIVNTINAVDTPSILTKAQNWVDKECSLIGYAQKMMEITGT